MAEGCSQGYKVGAEVGPGLHQIWIFPAAPSFPGRGVDIGCEEGSGCPQPTRSVCPQTRLHLNWNGGVPQTHLHLHWKGRGLCVSQGPPCLLTHTLPHPTA